MPSLSLIVSYTVESMKLTAIWRDMNGPCRLKKQVENAKRQLDKLIVTMESKEELKTVALGTSKINYLDPRITVAWCKRNDVPLERVFNKSLLGKFTWAMEVEPEFRF
jgi:DNA topoisomerase I